MSLLYSLPILAALSPPTPIGQPDYPIWALREGRSVAVLAEVWIDTDGRVFKCALQDYVGDEKLASWYCDGLRKARYEPARDANGQTLNFRGRWFVKFATSGKNERKVKSLNEPPEITARISQLPQLSPEGIVRLVLRVREDGTVEECELDKRNDSSALKEVGCQTAEQVVFPKGFAADGSAAPYLTKVLIKFELKSEV